MAARLPGRESQRPDACAARGEVRRAASGRLGLSRKTEVVAALTGSLFTMSTAVLASGVKHEMFVSQDLRWRKRMEIVSGWSDAVGMSNGDPDVVGRVFYW